MVAGRLDGTVRIKWSDGSSYDGSYKAGVREGKGVWRGSGFVYDGDWRGGKRTGQGTWEWDDGSSYVGGMKDNFYDGRGIFKWADGGAYVGEYRQGSKNGNGVRKWPDGQLYEGAFKDDRMHGKGQLKYANGATYEGDFANGRPSGPGVLKDPQGRVIYAGTWNPELDESRQEYPSAAQPATPHKASIGSDAAAAPEGDEQVAPPAQTPHVASVDSDPAQLRELRERLYELNFDPGAAEAPFAEADRRAILDFEAQSNLPPTGQATTALLQHLRTVGSQAPWGAIVFDKSSGKWGMAWEHASRKEAVASAVSSCGEARCSLELSFFGTECGAFAYSGSTWALAARANAEKAKQAALAECQKHGRSCRIVAAVCATGSDRREAGKPN